MKYSLFLSILIPLTTVGGSVELNDFNNDLTVSEIFRHQARNSHDNVGDLSQSVVTVNESDAVPDNQGWARCRNCGWKDDTFLVFSSDNNTRESSLDLSWSLWGEFFFKNRNDQFKANIVSLRKLEELLNNQDQRTVYHIDRPVYILPMITFHVGHVLIDLLQQVYNSMMSCYGMVRRDSLIIIDVAAEDERYVLDEKLFKNIYDPELDTFGSILTLFTELPIMSMKFLRDLSIEGVFVLLKDVHIGLDNSETYFYRGFNIHPLIFPVHRQSQAIKSLSDKYQKFRDFIQSRTTDLLQYKLNNSGSKCIGLCDDKAFMRDWATGSDTANSPEKPTEFFFSRSRGSRKILLVQREKNRMINNISPLINEAENYGSVLGVKELSRISFSDQIYLLQHTDVLIAVAGTALHNMLFMHPGSSVVILMQSGWCQWAWMYANQAVLLRIHYYIYCPENSGPGSISDSLGSIIDTSLSTEQGSLNEDSPVGFHWARKFWLQGPRTFKSENVTVDITSFSILIERAVRAIGKDTGTAVEHGDISTLGNILENIPPVKEVISPSRSRKQKRRILEVFISSLTVEALPTLSFGHNQTTWRIAIAGEFRALKGRAEALAESLPHMAVCINSLGSMTEPWCSDLEGLNYYSDIFMSVTEPVQYLHVWAQLSFEGGKIRGSDVFYAIDCTLPECGSGVHSAAVGLTLREMIEIESSGVISESGNSQKNVEVVFNHYIADRYSLQRGVVNFCSEHRLNPFSCGLLSGRLSSAAYKAVLMTKQNMPEKQITPTPQHPFVFVHIEKTGGTTLREFIAESAERLGLEYFIPCHGGVHCVTLSLTEDVERKQLGGHDGQYKTIKKEVMKDILKNVSVVAGHFFWDTWQHLPSASAVTRPEANRSDNMLGAEKAVPSCIIMGRDPIERAVSYYYQRCYRSPECMGFGRKLNDITVEELSVIAVEVRQGESKSDNATNVVIDEGMGNAACRALANMKVTTGLIVGVDELAYPPPLSREAGDKAIENSQKCVVGILERWDETKKVFNFWFPWLDFSEDSDRRRMFLYSGKESAADLRPELLEVILGINSCDVRLYERMLRRFELELSVVMLDTFRV